MSLQTILDAGYDYDTDCTILFSYDDKNRVTGFKRSLYSMNHGWTLSNQILATPEVKAFLVENDYRPINKRTNEQPFDTCWDYRKIAPDWPVFRNWLYVYYAYRHDQAEHEMGWYEGKSYMCEELIQAIAQRDVYLDILEQLNDVKPDLDSIIRWASKQQRKYSVRTESTLETILTREYKDGERRREQIMYAYGHFLKTVYEYREMMEMNKNHKGFGE